MRIPLRAPAVLLALTLLLTGCAQQRVNPQAGETPSVTVGLTYIPDIQFAPFYVAETEGLFTEEGVDVTLRHHGVSEGLFNALVAGEEDYVLAGGDELVQARAEGMDLVAIGQYYRQYPVVVIVPEASEITSPADLRGHRVGVPMRAGETWFGLQALMAEAGLTEDDLEIVEVGYTQQAALTTGQVDAVVGFVDNDQVQFDLAGIPTRVVPLTESGEVPLVSIVLATTRENLDADPETAAKVVDGMVAGITSTVESPASAVEDARSYITTLSETGAEAAAAATLDATRSIWITPGGDISATMEESEWSAMTTFMRDQGLLASPVAASEVMQNVHQ